MTEQPDLERLYQDAKVALAAKDYDRASDLLRQILKTDVDYKDASRLLAQTVKLRRRRWYNDPRLWGTLGALLLVGLGIYFFVKLQELISQPAASPVILPTDTPEPTMAPPVIATATALPTPIPFTWKRVSLGHEFERDTVTALIINPNDPEVLYAGMKNAGIYNSIDGGLSWHPAHSGLSNTHVNSLSIDPQNSHILYAGTMGGIFKTEDGGENWSKLGKGNFLLMDPQDSSHLYARDSDEIRESTDQGENWKTIYSSKEGCPGKIISWDIHPIDGKTLIIGAGEECEAGVYMSTDGGHTWTMIWSREYYNFQYLDRLAIGADKQGNYYIISVWGFLRSQSNNGEIDWKYIWDFSPPATFDSVGSVYFYCEIHLCKFNLDEEQRVTLGKPDVGTGLHTFTVITISPSDPNTIYVSGAGISVSRDGGLTWAKLNNGLGNTMLHLDPGLGNVSTLYLLSGGCKEIQIQSNEGGYTTIQTLYVSNNGGITWSMIPQTGCNLLKDAAGSTLYRTGESEDWIWRSQDGGGAWQRVTTPRFIQTIVAHTSQTGLLYGFTRDPFYQSRVNPYFQEEEYFYSDDYGHTWNKQGPPVSTKPCYGSTLQFIDAYRPMAIDPSNGNHVFVIDNGTLLESHDSCETTEAFATAPNTSMNTIAFDPNKPNTLYAGTDDGAYVSFDSGETWNQINDGLLGATVVYSIVVDKDSNIYAATPYGIFKLENK
jgi:photosystem II stability/assembly factor-like uncharacterized protein